MESWYRLEGMGAGEGHRKTPRFREGIAEPWAQSRHGIKGGGCRAPHQVLSYIGGATSSNSGVSLVYSMPSRNVSLRLQGLQEKDSGSYLCSVNVQDSQGTDRGHSTNTLELNVLGKWEASMGGKCLRGKVGGGGRGSVCGSGEGLPLVPWM